MKTTIERLALKDFSRIILPEDSADIAAEVVKTSICEPLENLVKFLEGHPHLKSVELLEKAQKLKYMIKKGEDVDSLVDEIYYSSCLADINHRYGKEDKEAQEMRNNLNYLLEEIRA
jgi:hypothetical protein